MNGGALEGTSQKSGGGGGEVLPAASSISLPLAPALCELRLLWPQFLDFSLILNASCDSCFVLPDQSNLRMQHAFCFPALAKG